MLQVHDGRLYVNGVAREEPFIYQKPAYTLGKLVVPPGDVSLRFPAATAGFCRDLNTLCLGVECSVSACLALLLAAHSLTHSLTQSCSQASTHSLTN